MDTLTVEQLIMRLQGFPQKAEVTFKLNLPELFAKGLHQGSVNLPLTHVSRPKEGLVVIE